MAKKRITVEFLEEEYRDIEARAKSSGRTIAAEIRVGYRWGKHGNLGKVRDETRRLDRKEDLVD